MKASTPVKIQKLLSKITSRLKISRSLERDLIFTDSCCRSPLNSSSPRVVRTSCVARIDRNPDCSCVHHRQCSSNPLYPRGRRRSASSSSSSRIFATSSTPASRRRASRGAVVGRRLEVSTSEPANQPSPVCAVRDCFATSR